MTEQEQIDSLKAQVNCLRAELSRTAYMLITDCSVYQDAIKALNATPEQCLAEVKAKAIEDVANALLTDEDYHRSDKWYANYIMCHANKLREQAK